MPDDFDLRDFLPYVLNLAAERQSQAFQKTYRDKYGMLRTEWRVLFHLGRYGDMTSKDICDRARLHKTKVSRAVAALETKRYLTRTEIETDRRHSSLTLTKAGQKVYADLKKEAGRFNSGLKTQMTAKEAQVLHKCLTRLADL